MRRQAICVLPIFQRFQSTHPRRVRLLRKIESIIDDLFQSTHPRRVRPGLAVCCDSYIMFQSTHPRRVRHRRYVYCQHSRGFNPRTHVGCDLLRMWRRLTSVSFNPRTHVGCDIPLGCQLARTASFNPRTHVGCDFVILYNVCNVMFQSTHPRRVRLEHVATLW